MTERLYCSNVSISFRISAEMASISEHLESRNVAILSWIDTWGNGNCILAKVVAEISLNVVPEPYKSNTSG